jgi:hypothetical protein
MKRIQLNTQSNDYLRTKQPNNESFGTLKTEVFSNLRKNNPNDPIDYAIECATDCLIEWDINRDPNNTIIEIIKFFIDEQGKSAKCIINDADKEGHLEVIQWLHKIEQKFV